MKITILLNYQKSEIFDKLIIWRMIDEIFTLKPESIPLNVQGNIFNKSLSLNFEVFPEDYPSQRYFLSTLLKKGHELKQLLNSSIWIKIMRTQIEVSKISIDFIQGIVANYYNIPMDLMQSNTRKREVVQARQVAMKLCRLKTKKSFEEIGLHIGNKTHGTVISACTRIDGFLEIEPKFREQFNEIKNRITF